MSVPFSERLRAVLARRGWSQERLARELGISNRTVSRWLSGSKPRDYEKLVALFPELRPESEIEQLWSAVSEMQARIDDIARRYDR